MLFTGLKTEKEVEALKRYILRDKILYAKFCRARDKMNTINEKMFSYNKVVLATDGQNKKLPTNAELLTFYRELVKTKKQKPSRDAEQILRKIKVRSNSGVAVVSLLTKPYTCPGKCIYCPTEKSMPKSSLSKEPAAARALANNFDAYQQITNRLRALVINGHPVDKLEIIIIGGTWSFYNTKYQEKFVSEIFRACNNFIPRAEYLSERIKKGQKTLKEMQKVNEKAKARVIGLSIETRPDYINEKELEKLRNFGVTKVEIGVQQLDNKVLEYNKRGITTEEVARATELLRNTGMKVVYHMMPNLPKSTPKKDIEMFKRLFSGKDFQPDMLKIYPCIVLKKSPLFKIFLEGGFRAYTDKQLTAILIGIKKLIPLYTRIIRVIRDIPATYIMTGSKISNLRQVIEQNQKKDNWKCHCMRCREVRNEEVKLKDYKLSRIQYETQTGREIFLSYENKKENKCAAFCRLRLPDKKIKNNFSGNLRVLEGVAIIRELHTYGQLIKIKEKGSQSQHRGFGMRLMEEAETIARKEGYTKMAVIAGVGVQDYYRKKLGYKLDRTYMVKRLL